MAELNINKANESGNKISEAEMKRDVEKAAKILATKAKKSITIPKQLAPVVGETMISCINGACIRVPVDGEEYEIPEPFFHIIKESLKTVNSGDVRSSGILDVGANDQFLESVAAKSTKKK